MTGTKTSHAWKRCGVCKRELGFDAEFYECSVSTCTSGRNHPVFCTVVCWEQHVPVMRHRDAWAEQKRSPSRAQWERDQAAADAAPASAVHAPPPRRIVVGGSSAGTASPASDSSRTSPAAPGADDILIVASKLKAYIRARSGMNTSDTVLEELSDVVREHADRAIENARLDGRRTVMDRDFRKLPPEKG